MAQVITPLIERFNSKVIRMGIDECWGWNAAKDNQGYGRIGMRTVRGKRAVQASRVSWMLFVGDIPEGLSVCHRCDNPECTNPKHLFLGTPKQNTLDMVAKGRCMSGKRFSIRTHCKNGHEFSLDNTKQVGNVRKCKTCQSQRVIKWFGLHRKRFENNAIKTQCKWGHPFNEENTYIAKSGSRQCKTCTNNRKLATYHKEK